VYHSPRLPVGKSPTHPLTAVSRWPASVHGPGRRDGAHLGPDTGAATRATDREARGGDVDRVVGGSGRGGRPSGVCRDLEAGRDTGGDDAVPPPAPASTDGCRPQGGSPAH